ncbi:[Fe-Fe] hydrogenase large subunit C-terminal domain-containing protein [Thermoanaerobacterium sp. DL9XJH110]|uniref:[Fe-Fe] hydrogenase large subunit C-terminal domain-containing protein n=1 Tax=Thermoanaerobacterium sp. DL9XJH110 TaxID=3386643 RepID=UPI003BB5AA99
MGVINFARANCKNCYKCIRSCPVKAIRMNNHQAEIVEERCITCGTCLTVCPQNAKTVRNDIEKVKELLKNDDDVAVSLAPSFAGAFSFRHYSQMVAAVRRLGFSGVYQTSVGARLIAAEYLKHYNDKSKSILITTACPAVNYLIEKYYPELVKYMIPVVSPMEAHGRYLKKIKGHSKVVFIGPCLAKKVEIHDESASAIDAVITFEELKAWWAEKGIDPGSEEIDERQDAFVDDANFYPLPGGGFKTVEPFIEDRWRSFISVDGMENCMIILDELKNGELKGTWIEINACHGGCGGGPAVGETQAGRFSRLQRIREFASNHSRPAAGTGMSGLADGNFSLELKKDFKAVPVDIKYPAEEEIQQILAKIGKYRREHQLNCGACGYNTCREKAMAVYNGMAETYMCMPYMRNRAESLSNLIIDSTPNALIAVSHDMTIQEFNPAAEQMFQTDGRKLYQKPLSLLFDDKDFRYVCETHENIINKKVNIQEYGLVTLQNIYYLKGHDLIIGIISDITEQERARQRNIEIRKKTIDTTQQVIEKQMRVAQEIASLLGETTAETKVMLNKIKRLLIEEMPGDENENKD